MNESSIGTVALIGHPNVGKTSLFNALTGEKEKVGNYHGITVEGSEGYFYTPHGKKLRLLDLPGLYSHETDSLEAKVALEALKGESQPDLILCLADASDLQRHMPLLLQTLELGLPVALILTKVDMAEKSHLRLNPQALSDELGIPVIPIHSPSEKGLVELKHALRSPLPHPVESPSKKADIHKRAEELAHIGAHSQGKLQERLEEKLDDLLLHPVWGWVVLLGVLAGVFWSIFRLATYPMDWIDGGIALIQSAISGYLPKGELSKLIVDGMVGGVGSVLVFIPQIALLFFCLSLIESTGYLARAAFLMDKVLTQFGLSGRSFLPLLSGYACAIPGVMACRTIPDGKERLLAILIMPWTSCSARLPVYFLLIPLLVDGAGMQTLILFATYILGSISAVVAAAALRKPVAGNSPQPSFLLELPAYQTPNWSFIRHHVFGRTWAFIRKAGTLILGLSILLWALQSYPKSAPESTAQEQYENSLMGKIGTVIEPVVHPLGWDARLGTAVLTSFAAREVLVSSLAISYSVEEEEGALREKLQNAQKPDGSPLYPVATVLSLLVFFIYALQCLPTTAVVQRETGSWKWALGQFFCMTIFAYLAALCLYQVTSFFL